MGDAGTEAKFGNVIVSAAGYYDIVLTTAAISAGTELIIDATAQVSASGFGASLFKGTGFVTIVAKGD